MLLGRAARIGTEIEPHNGDGYPRSWPDTLPPGGEIACPLTRASLRIAEALARRRFARHPDCEERVCDAVSVAWEMAMQEHCREGGHPGSIATLAVKRVASRRHFAESLRSVDCPHSGTHERPKRSGFFPAELAARAGTDPAEAVAFQTDVAAWLATLTTRQQEVALLLATGHTTAEIAAESGCTTNAVRMLRMTLRQKWQQFLSETDQPVSWCPSDCP